MPSSQSQSGIILSKTDKKTGKKTYILISKRTGFKDVTINGQHFYYNATGTFKKAKDISFEKIIKDNSKIQQLSNQKIIVRRTKTDYATI